MMLFALKKSGAQCLVLGGVFSWARTSVVPSECSKVGTEQQREYFQRLHQLISGTGDVQGFLEGMTSYAAVAISQVVGAPVECAVTLRRPKRAVSIAGSSDDAVLLEGKEQANGEGPTHLALATLAPVIVSDAGTEPRWPDYCQALTTAGVSSVLAVPLSLGEDAVGALKFFSAETGSFTTDVVSATSAFADIADQALRLALRIATADLLAHDLKAAMERRTVIDMACGVIMAQNHCTQREAFEFLQQASQNRNQKTSRHRPKSHRWLRGTAGRIDILR